MEIKPPILMLTITIKGFPMDIDMSLVSSLLIPVDPYEHNAGMLCHLVPYTPPYVPTVIPSLVPKANITWCTSYNI